MTQTRYRHFAVALTVISGLGFAALRSATAAEAEKPSNTAAASKPSPPSPLPEREGKLQKFSAGPVVLDAPSQRATFDAENGRIVISTRQGDRLVKRAEAAFASVKRFQGYKTVRSASINRNSPPRQGIEIYSDDAEAECTLFVDGKGVFEFKPGKARQLVLHGLQFRYGLVPSLVGTDLLYDADHAYMAPSDQGGDRLYIPALNILVGLVEGEDCMAVGVWPPGKQSAVLTIKPGKGPGEVKPESRLFDSLTFDTAGQSFYFSCLEKPGIWRAEPLKRNYLEKDTVIDWKRPFEAKWVGRFSVTSDEYDWPFSFANRPTRTWGKYIRGWYNYPLRFDGTKTVVHFEKQFQPKGDLLIYCLEASSNRSDSSVLTPFEVLARALGKAQADKILDREGTVEQTLMRHGMAVCAMLDTMQEFYDQGNEREHRDRITQLCNDVSTFIRLIRERDQAYGAFARDLQTALAARAKQQPELAASIADLQKSLAEIEKTSAGELPRASLETVRQWTDEMQKTVDGSAPANKKTFLKLSEQCRSVAGTQDDLARDLSVLVIRLSEQAARIGVQSPQHVQLAEEVIVKSRQMLRKPTWWEPVRRSAPMPE
jgi:hypothetical protein